MEILDAEVIEETERFIPDIPLSKSRFGWCMDGHHDGCPAYIPPREHIDPAAPKPRKGKPKTYTLPPRRCPCPCHARDLD